jgi:HD superfamily phosphodiesterase
MSFPGGVNGSNGSAPGSRYTMIHAEKIFSRSLTAQLQGPLALALNSPLVRSMVDLIPGKSVHSRRLMYITEFLGTKMALRTELLSLAALFHDAGQLPEKDQEKLAVDPFRHHQTQILDLRVLRGRPISIFGGAEDEERRYHPHRIGTLREVGLITGHPRRGALLVGLPVNRIIGISDDEVKIIQAYIASHHGNGRFQGSLEDNFREWLMANNKMGTLYYPLDGRPTSREAAILMILDSCDARLSRKHHEVLYHVREGIAKALPMSELEALEASDPIYSEEAIRKGIVLRVIGDLADQGQLDMAGLTGDDINKIILEAPKAFLEIWRQLETPEEEPGFAEDSRP